MISLPIWLVTCVIYMRKSFNGLGELVQHTLEENPFSGQMFIFRVPQRWHSEDTLG